MRKTDVKHVNPVSGPRFEPWTSHIQVYKVTAVLICSVCLFVDVKLNYEVRADELNRGLRFYSLQCYKQREHVLCSVAEGVGARF